MKIGKTEKIHIAVEFIEVKKNVSPPEIKIPAPVQNKPSSSIKIHTNLKDHIA